jgi:PAS domain-containing protein
MPSTADEGSRSLSNVGLPRTDWESMFWAVFAASENPMAIVDANRWVVSANGALQHLLSRAEEEIVGRSIDESLPPPDQRTIADRWRAMDWDVRNRAREAQIQRWRSEPPTPRTSTEIWSASLRGAGDGSSEPASSPGSPAPSPPTGERTCRHCWNSWIAAARRRLPHASSLRSTDRARRDDAFARW